jgi:hypothetical protein
MTRIAPGVAACLLLCPLVASAACGEVATESLVEDATPQHAAESSEQRPRTEGESSASANEVIATVSGPVASSESVSVATSVSASFATVATPLADAGDNGGQDAGGACTGSSTCNGTCMQGGCLVTFSGWDGDAAGVGNDEEVSITSDGTTVYWSVSAYAGSSNGVFSAPVGGGSITQVFNADQQNCGATGLVRDSDSIYWGTCTAGGAGAVMRQALSGGPATAVASGSQVYAEYLAVDDTNVYWASNSTIFTAPKGGGPATMLVDASSVELGGAAILALGAQQGVAYWSDYSFYGIHSVTVGGAVSTLLTYANPTSVEAWTGNGAFPAPPWLTSFVFVGDSVYMAAGLSQAYDTESATNGLLMRGSLSGGAPTTLASPSDTAFVDVAVLGSSLYWVQYVSVDTEPYGNLYRGGLDGSQPVAIAPNVSAGFLSAESGRVYWSDGVDVYEYTPASCGCQ